MLQPLDLSCHFVLDNKPFPLYTLRMKIVKNIKRATKAQIAALSMRETSNVITVAVSTKTPVVLQRANIGTSVRPQMATIVNGAETIESFLARGGSIKLGKPASIPVVPVRVKGSRNMANTQMKLTRSVKSIEVNQ